MIQAKPPIELLDDCYFSFFEAQTNEDLLLFAIKDSELCNADKTALRRFFGL